MYVTTGVSDHVALVTFENPARRNALSEALVGEVLAAFEDLRQKQVRAVILQAAPGAKVWSAGHDIDELTPNQDPLRYSDPLERLLRAVRSMPAPVIALVRGSVWGGATELVLSCDLVVGDETCSFAITPAKLGLAYNTVGLLAFMQRLPINLVRELLYTSRPVNAPDAARWGILNHLVPAEQLDAFTHELAATIAARAPLEIATVKEQLRILSEAAPLAPSTFDRLEDLRRAVYQSPDYTEGLTAFHEHRQPVFGR